MYDISGCEAALSDAHNCLALFKAWKIWRGAETIPSARMVRPEMLGRSLAGMAVIECHAPDKLVYRLVGELYGEIFGRELKGQNLLDFTVEAERVERIRRTDSIISTPCGSIGIVNVLSERGLRNEIRTLLLPVWPTEEGQPLRIYCAISNLGTAAEPTEIERPPVPLAQSFHYVDIGFGVPD